MIAILTKTGQIPQNWPVFTTLYVLKDYAVDPIKITTLKANYLYIRMLAFFICGLGIDLGIVLKIIPS